MKYLIILIIGLSSYIPSTSTIDLRSDDVWKKVKITTSAKDIEGLTAKGTVKGIVLKVAGQTNKEREDLAHKKLKKQAAIKDCYIVLLITKKEEPNKLTILGRAYQ